MPVDTKNRNIIYPTKTPKNGTKHKRIHYYNICAQNGCHGISIRWMKYDGKWIPLENDYPDILHLHRNAEDELLDWEFEYIRGR